MVPDCTLQQALLMIRHCTAGVAADSFSIPAVWERVCVCDGIMQPSCLVGPACPSVGVGV